MPSARPAPGLTHTFRDGHTVAIKWHYVVALGLMHLAVVLAPFTFSWTGLAAMALLCWLCGGVGICLGYHRLLTHRSFHTPKWLEYVITLLGALTMQGGPVTWVGTHRLHHAESDQPGDPHSPTEGFGWAHICWLLFDDHPGRKPADAAKDLQRDPVLAFIDRWSFAFQLPLAALLLLGGYLLGGWPLAASWVVWGVAVRVVITYHGTWFVNSASHTWGYRNFSTTDQSKNNWWVAVLAFGEGWHNNHHAQQRSAAHGMRWWEVDVTWWTIRALELVGLAKRVVRPDVQAMDRHARPAAEAGLEGRMAGLEGRLPGLERRMPGTTGA